MAVIAPTRDRAELLTARPSVCAGLSLSFQMEVEDVCPQIELPGSWDEHLAGLGKKDRHELRRKLRRLPQGGKVQLETLEDADSVDGAIDTSCGCTPPRARPSGVHDGWDGTIVPPSRSGAGR